MKLNVQCVARLSQGVLRVVHFARSRIESRALFAQAVLISSRGFQFFRALLHFARVVDFVLRHFEYSMLLFELRGKRVSAIFDFALSRAQNLLSRAILLAQRVVFFRDCVPFAALFVGLAPRFIVADDSVRLRLPIVQFMFLRQQFAARLVRFVALAFFSRNFIGDFFRSFARLIQTDFAFVEFEYSMLQFVDLWTQFFQGVVVEIVLTLRFFAPREITLNALYLTFQLRGFGFFNAVVGTRAVGDFLIAT